MTSVVWEHGRCIRLVKEGRDLETQKGNLCLADCDLDPLPLMDLRFCADSDEREQYAIKEWAKAHKETCTS